MYVYMRMSATLQTSLCSCFIGEPGVFWGAFLGPIFAILLFNAVIFVTVVVILVRHSRSSLGRVKEQQNSKTTVRLLISIVGIMSLFGLSWFFAALTVREASTAFQFLFVIFNSLQGFFIFIFFCVLSKDARELWRELLSCGRYQSSFHPSKPYASSSSATARARTRATKSTTLTGTDTGGPSTMKSELTSSDTHPVSAVTGYESAVMTSTFYSTPGRSEDSFTQPSAPKGEATQVQDETVFANPVAAEVTGSLMEETNRELNFRRSLAIEPTVGTGTDNEGGGAVDLRLHPVEIDVDLDDTGEEGSWRIRGVVV